MPQYRVMIVEDEGIVSIDLRGLLNNMGYIVSGMAFSGEEALKKFSSSQSDLVLMDIGLKGKLDGIETAQRIKQKSDIPIIFLTGFADKNTLNRADQVKPAAYIIKPINETDLQLALQKALP